MPVTIDYHLHTNNTEDGENTLLEMAERAAELGLTEIAITDHHIKGLKNYCVGPRVIERHFADAVTASKRYGITVLIGLEIDYISRFHKGIEKFIRSFDFDVVMGAAHIVEGYGLAGDVTAAEYFKMFPPVECFLMYFDHLKEAAISGLFDVMAHLDIVRKYAVTAGADIPFEQYADQAAEAADALLRSDTGFEMNCRGFDHPPEEQYPSAPFLEVLAGKGVGKVTIGSDAHSTDLLGANLELGAAALRDAGFTQLCVFRKRRHDFIPLPD